MSSGPSEEKPTVKSLYGSLSPAQAWYRSCRTCIHFDDGNKDDIYWQGAVCWCLSRERRLTWKPGTRICDFYHPKPKNNAKPKQS